MTNLSKIFKDPGRNMFSIIVGVGVIVLIVVLFRYNKDKSSNKDGLRNRVQGASLSDAYAGASDASNNNQLPGGGGELVGASVLDEEDYLQVQGINTTVPDAQSCNGQPTLNPSELLPKDINNEWAAINPATTDLKNMNLLSANQMIGINTISGSHRNANYQLRSDPVIQKVNLGPWNQSTMEQDTTRRPLEIGYD